jgi:type II secretory ATPase GspE/PulE/Tfp pilus assembly ATPase PilB-like protein
MRILRQDSSLLSIDKLDLLEGNEEKIKRALESKHGMLLVAGPTGSGKTTTLFSMLKSFDPHLYNISTLEDPVEYNIPYINQTKVRPEIEFDFATGLRHLVRQDPDIIMVGEIRDRETIALAIEASLTGHLVLSTIHTNSAAATIQRIINMGVEPFLISSALKMVASQRLVKRLCPHCASTALIIDPAVLQRIDIHIDGLLDEKAQDIAFGVPVGCEQCDMTGYQGRIGVHEVMEMKDQLVPLILEKASAQAIEAKAKELGMINIVQDAIIKAATGKTTIEEALRLS